ncbi:MAG TPA: replication initiation factor domain-containing protein [Rhodocyclaceae bacterium]|nr:replication initiation factor domain-containing protein [Rhodocyclaceae bacterium]
MAVKSKICKPGQGMTLAELDQLGAVPSAELSSVGRSIQVQLEEAWARLGAERSEAAGRADAPPLTNRGGKSEEAAAGETSVGSQGVAARLVLEGGEIKEIPARRGWGGSSAFLDWVNFTVHESTFEWSGDEFTTDEQIIMEASTQLEKIFGFGVTVKRETGANFYKRSYVLGDGWGMVCHGGQRRTVLVMLSGEGCAAASDGWEKRLHDWLLAAQSPRITRCDLAHDVYEGEISGPVLPGSRLGYSVDQANRDFDDGLFNSGGRNPDCEQRGNWKKPNGKGRTLYVGSRANGKFCRVYEKGRQLGAKDSEWVRIEVEFKSVDRQIPFDVLLRPGEYLAASYPAFAWISQRQERILTTQRTVQTKYEKACAWAKHQVGALLAVVAEVEGGAENMLKKLARYDREPAFTKVPNWRLSPKAIHEAMQEMIPSMSMGSDALMDYGVSLT